MKLAKSKYTFSNARIGLNGIYLVFGANCIVVVTKQAINWKILINSIQYCKNQQCNVMLSYHWYGNINVITCICKLSVPWKYL